VDGVFTERAHAVFHVGAAVDGGEGLLAKLVAKAGRPLAGAETSRGGAIVHHVGDAAGVHVRVERVNRFNDGLVGDFRIGVPVLHEDVDLGHHRADVDARGERIERDRFLVPLGADAVAGLPHFGAIDGAHRPPLEAVSGQIDAADLVAGGDFVVDLLKDGTRGGIRGVVGTLKDLPFVIVEGVVDREEALLGDGLGDGASDRFAGVVEGLFVAHAGGRRLRQCHGRRREGRRARRRCRT